MTVKVIDQERKDRACEIIQALPFEPVMSVEIFEFKEQRSAAQNRLMWLWITILAGEHGLTKEEVHHGLKKTLLLPIFIREKKKYAEMVATFKMVSDTGDRKTAVQMYNLLADLASTTEATVTEFSEYLDDIDKLSITQQIYLPHPEDVYRDAMGH